MSETEQVRTEIEDIRARSDDLADVSDCSPDNPVPGHIVDSIGPVAQANGPDGLEFIL